MKHDAEQYVYENYGKCLSHILRGTPFKNTNGPKGVEYQNWTIAGVIEQAARENEAKAAEELAKIRRDKADAKAAQAKL
jgi:hypothetical protein